MRAGPLMAVLLLAACAGAPPSSPGTSSPVDPVRILATGLYLESVGHFGVAVAADETEWNDLAREVTEFHPGQSVTLDLDRDMAIYLGMAGSSSCPETFTGLVVDEDAARVYGEWQSTPVGEGQGCTDDLQPQGVLLAVSRAELPASQFTLSLRESLVCVECPDHADQIVVDPTD